ncbi:ROK family transcriptional regulator [Pelosinus propionicus]|uniref:ROK family protein (Putative glucokinase) n=1 Tax=Pelosinus propionicus DSM 13327 TaxID=1123291 RepID=A0A1I4M6W7_9FIRM|nr:ROK family transcriptional regulator [Pelosinus propionicus]SFL98755.1 ROK family protein (putative glucokinase) [Pelosinus propionicus DSM 13327]
MKTADQVLVKQINKMIVLNTIYKKRPISRAEIAKVTGLNKSTVSALVDELLTEELVLEMGAGESQGGRRPVNLSINKEVGNIIGIDLGVNYILSIMTNFAGEIIWEKRIDLQHAHNSPGQRIADLQTLIEEMIVSASQTVRGIIGIGIGVPGIVNYEQGLILSAPNLGWENIELRSMIEQKFGIPVFIDNEANAGAIGEKWFGAGKRADEFLYISAGTGIGAGIIINNELYRGSKGLSGEIGHMTVSLDGIPCSCGNAGCLEEYASEKALFRYMKEYACVEELTIFNIIDNAIAGDEVSRKAFEYVGKCLGIGVANLINAFNPQLVIIGNSLPLVGDILMNELRREAEKRCFASKYFSVKILPSQLNMHACAMGAAALVISRLYASPVS